LKVKENLQDIEVVVAAELGRTIKTLGDVKSFAEGSLIELDKDAG
jgi:flagellar motor switch/type III secretory pathway protein FliN